MDPPPPNPPLSATHNAYPDSYDSSPRSRNADSWDEPLPPVSGAKLRLMCSYGGHIVPRPHDKYLCYLGGDTRIIVVDRHTSLSELTNRLSRSLLNGRIFTLKYQLPNEDLDSLISVTTDEDLENMIEEHDRNSSTSSLKPSRIRIFLFPTKPETAASMGSLLDDSKSESWFVEALNGSGAFPRGYSVDTASINCLLGLDVGSSTASVTTNVDKSSPTEVEPQNDSLGNFNKQMKSNQDVQSVPDSPMLETNSSFGSSTSSPSMANLPPIRVHVEDQKIGFEEQLSQMGISSTTSTVTTAAVTTNLQQPKQEEGSVVVQGGPPPLPTTIVTGAPQSAPINGENQVYQNRVVSDDERSDQGAPTGFRKPPQPPQLQQRTNGGVDLPSPDANTRDSSLQEVIGRSKPMYYQEQVVQVQSRDNRVTANLVDRKRDVSNPNYTMQMHQQVQESGYFYPSQLDEQQQLQREQQQEQQQQQLQQQQQQQQLQQQQQRQSQHQQQQQQQQQQQHQQQQYIHGGGHYIHHHPTQQIPMSSYYSIHPQQQQQQLHHQVDPHYPPVYYVTVPQSQAYNMSMQSNISDSTSISSSRPPMPPNPSMLPTPSVYKESAAPVFPSRAAPHPSKPELPANVYRTATTATPPLVQVPVDQHYMGYQTHQSIASGAGVAPATNYGYEYADPNQASIYYTQPLGATLHSQYQTMTSAAAVAMSEAMDNTKQQNRTPQPQ